MDKIKLTDFETGCAVSIELANVFSKTEVNKSIKDFDEVDLSKNPEYDVIDKEIYQQIKDAMSSVNLRVPKGYGIYVKSREASLMYCAPADELDKSCVVSVAEDYEQSTGSNPRAVKATRVQAIGEDSAVVSTVMQSLDEIEGAIEKGVSDLHDPDARKGLINEIMASDPQIMRDVFSQAAEGYIFGIAEQLNELDKKPFRKAAYCFSRLGLA